MFIEESFLILDVQCVCSCRSKELPADRFPNYYGYCRKLSAGNSRV